MNVKAYCLYNAHKSLSNRRFRALLRLERLFGFDPYNSFI